jgi:competence protein ComEC
MSSKGIARLIFAVLVILDLAVWLEIVASTDNRPSEIVFLDVGQGDATLLLLKGEVTILTDAGPDFAVVPALEKALNGAPRSIDIAIVTHPQADHFYGFIYLMERYRIGAFIVNGRQGSVENGWNDFIEAATERQIPIVTMGAGDTINHGASKITMLSPSRGYIESAELNDTGFVGLVETPEWTALLAADIGTSVEEFLMRERVVLGAQILKVAHHGSRYSSSEQFLQAVDPRVAVIHVGAKNRYGHPAQETLDRLESLSKMRIFRTDRHGTVRVRGGYGSLRVTTAKAF